MMENAKVDYSICIISGLRPTPYAYKEPYIFLVLATTPLKDLKFTDEIRNKISLRKFNLSDFEFIFGKLLGTYRSAYKDFNLNSSLYNSILNAALEKSSLELRDFIKFCIDSFDWVD